MGRPLRIEFEGAVYHVLARGNEKKPIFHERDDYRRFLELLEEINGRFCVVIYCYVLMGNHYHLLLETRLPNLSQAMHHLNSTYTRYFNRKSGRVGHLFQGRYKSHLVEKDDYLLQASRYIHLNPVRAGIAGQPAKYPWSSYGGYIGAAGKREKWLEMETILGQLSGDRFKAKGLYRQFVESEEDGSLNPFLAAVDGFFLGSQKFVSEIKMKLGGDALEKPKSLLSDKPGHDYDAVVAAVAEEFRVHVDSLFEQRQRKSPARGICIYLLKNLAGMSNAEIAAKFAISEDGVRKMLERHESEIEAHPRTQFLFNQLSVPGTDKRT